MTNALVDYWQSFKPSHRRLNFHPKDEGWLGDCLSQPFLGSHSQFAASDRFENKNGLHLSLLPVPYIGNLSKAKIIIFLQNPGFNTGDYLLEEQPEFRDLAAQNMNQEDIPDYPFIYLNPKFSWCPGFQWWEARFDQLLRR